METLKEKVIAAHKLSEKYMQMNDDAVESLASILHYKEIGKNQFLLKEREVCEYLYYVEKGLIRQFYYKYGKDVTEQFAVENDICLNAESYLYQKPGNLIVETLEPTAVYCIPAKDLFRLISECAEINKMYRLMLESLLIRNHQRIDSLRLDSAPERYMRFLEEYPVIVQRAPLFHIASYLLMSPETLSRVRSSFTTARQA